MNKVNVPRENINTKELITEALPLIDWLYNFAFYLAADRHKSKLLIKRTYNKVLEYYDKTKGGADYKSWMVRVMLNRVYELYEKQRSSEKNDLDKEFLFQVTSLTEADIANINETFTNSVNRKILLNIIKKIPIDLKLPLFFLSTLKYNYSLSAEYIDIPEGVIASRLFRARKWIFYELSENLKLVSSQLKLEYRDMKMISSLADGEQLHNDETESRFPEELKIQQLIKDLLATQLVTVNTPRLIKSKFHRKVKRIIKKSDF